MKYKNKKMKNDFEKRKTIFNLLSKYYNNKAINYGDYFLAAVCFSAEINKFKKIKNKSFKEINDFFKKEKILKNIKICEIGGDDLLKLKQYGAEVKTNNILINLKNYNSFFNKKFDLTASAYFFSSYNFIKINENEIYNPKNQIRNAIELLSVFSLLTKKNHYSIHKGADLLNNRSVIKTLNKINFKKICKIKGIVVLEKV
jgi:hypothetical protein